MSIELTHSNGIHIPHFSPSTVNSWIQNKFGFYRSKILREPFKGNANMSRGKAIEHAINEWLACKVSPSDIQECARENFIKECKECDADFTAVKEMLVSLPGLVALAFEKYSSILPTGYLSQIKVEARFPGVKRDVVGYMDYHKPSVETRDCKVTNRKPPGLSQSYIIQGSFYRYKTTVPTVFDFFVDNKKPAYHELILTDNQYKFGLSYFIKAMQAMEELEECQDSRRVIELMSFPDLESFWNEEERKQAADIWEIEL